MKKILLLLFILGLLGFAQYDEGGGYYSQPGTGRTATVTVAAYNSSPLSKSQADYVCDSIGDQFQINTAIDYAATFNGSVYLSEGLFTTTAQINMKTNVCLIGSGPSSTKIQTNANINVISAYNVNNIQIKNIWLYGPKLGSGDNKGIIFKKIINGLIENCRSGNFDGWGFLSTDDDVVADSCVNIKFLNLEAYDNSGNGIECTGTKGAEIVSCICHDNGIRGIEIWGNSTNVTVTGGYCYKNGYHGVLIKNAKWVSLNGVQSSKNTESGFYVLGDTIRQAQYITLNGCIASKNTKHGIVIEKYSKNISINGCSADSNTYTGLLIGGILDSITTKDVVITSGQYVRNGWAGISIGYDQTVTYDSRVDNILIDNAVVLNNTTYQIYKNTYSTNVKIDQYSNYLAIGIIGNNINEGDNENIGINKNSNKRTQFRTNYAFCDTVIVDSLRLLWYQQADSNIIDSIGLKLIMSSTAQPTTVIWGDSTNSSHTGGTYASKTWTSLISGIKLSVYNVYQMTFYGLRMNANNDIQIGNGILFCHPQ